VIDWCDVRVEGHSHEHGRPQIPAGHWLLSIHYAERGVDKVHLADACGCGEEEWNGTCETVVFGLSPLPEGRCECGDPGCPGECGCVRDGCFQPGMHVAAPEAAHEADAVKYPAGAALSDDAKKALEEELAAREKKDEAEGKDKDDSNLPVPIDHVPFEAGSMPPPYPRGPHATLCCWSKAAEVLTEPGRLCGWRGVRLDPCDGVALACLAIGECEAEPPKEKYPKYPDDPYAKDAGAGARQPPGKPAEVCCDPVVETIDACTARRFVKRTDMLFDLIRGCDLTRIVHLSWAGFVARGHAEWDEFAGYFHAHPEDKTDCPTGFSIDFSGPVISDTITLFDVTVTAWFLDSDSGWFEPYRVPLAGFRFDAAAGDPPGTCRRATLVANWDWWDDEIRSRNSEFKGDWDRPAGYPVVDIDIDGSRILDCRGQPVAAAAFGPGITPTGLGYPGGLCRSSFRVTPPRR
jgi:hypothetical protein